VSTVPPVRREILVDAGPAAAFDVFTAGIGRWWPIAEKSVHGAGGTVAFTGGQIVEQAAGGQRAVWGTVTRWDPPAAVAFTWHPGQTPERESHVEVTFAKAGAQTLVTVVHTGWDAFADPAAARAEYDQGWPMVLGCYQAQAGQHEEAAAREPDGGADGGGGDTWVALLHLPGPEAPRDASIFEDPRFGEHVAFLTRMRAAGYLVAAGPMTDAAGEGMTILRLPGTGQFARATRLATEDDSSVAQGFFTVTVRPWQVTMHAWPEPAS
jgi:uncharacterized protein YciI